MFRPDRRTAVLPLTAAILLGTAGSALAIPNTDPNNPPPPPPNQAPTAALSVTPNPGLVAPQLQVTAISAKIPGGGLDSVLNRNAVSFDASASSDPDGSISKYLWDLDGNGSFEKTTTTPKVSRGYTQPGDFVVKVRVLDDGNKFDTATKTLKIHRAPVAKIAAAPQDITVGKASTLSAAGSTDDNGIAKYEWDLDGNGTFETNTAHGPDRAGSVHDRRSEDRPRQGDRRPQRGVRRADHRRRAPGPRRGVQRLAEPRARR